MRLIDADALLDRLLRTPRYFAVKFDIEEAPTVDAVPVVRCKDCKYVKHWKNIAGVEGVGCYLLAVDTHPDSFCSFGERKENDCEV